MERLRPNQWTGEDAEGMPGGVCELDWSLIDRFLNQAGGRYQDAYMDMDEILERYADEGVDDETFCHWSSHMAALSDEHEWGKNEGRIRPPKMSRPADEQAINSFSSVLIETAQAIDDLCWILEDDGEFESPDEYTKHWKYWIDLPLDAFVIELRQHLTDNQVFAEEFKTFVASHEYSAHAAKNESVFLARIEFEQIYQWLHNHWEPGKPE